MQFFVDLLRVLLDGFAVYTGYGFAIVLVSAAVTLITYPLNAKQMEFSFKTRILQPKLDEIKKKYKNDQNTLNEKTMELWKEHNLNPAAGCLPLLIQMPILIAMFRLLQDETSFGVGARFFGLNLALPSAEMSLTGIYAQQGALVAAGYLIIPALAVVTTIMHQKQVSANVTDSTMRTMNMFLPVFTLWLTIRYPTALGIYWVARNVFSIGQHSYFNYQMENRQRLAGGGS